MSIPYDSRIARLQQEELELRYALAEFEREVVRLLWIKERAVADHEEARLHARRLQTRIDDKVLEIDNTISRQIDPR